MIKKISHIIFAILILASTSGMTISEHYCGDSLRSKSFMHEADACCDIPDGCCHNESTTYSIEDSFSISNFSFEFESQVNLVPVDYEIKNVSLFEQTSLVPWIDIPPHPNISSLIANTQSFLL